MSAPSVPSPKSVIDNWFRTVWNEGKREAIRELFVGTAGGLNPTTGEPLDVEMYEAHWDEFRRTIDNINVGVREVIEAGDRGSCHFILTGTHKATGQNVWLEGIAMFSIDQQGRIVDATNVLDLFSLARQLDMVPADGMTRVLTGTQLV